MACLVEPGPERLVRPVDDIFVQHLMREMLDNTISEVAPMIGLVRLNHESFHKRQCEAYKYEIIGGNNSREALARLMKEKPLLSSDPNFKNRPVSVYSNLTNEEAQYLGIKHNRATHFIHEMTVQEKVMT